VGSTLAFGSLGHGFESEHRLFSHHGASAFSKLRSLRSAHWTIQFVDCCSSLSYSYPPGKANRVAARTSGSAAELTQRTRKSFAYTGSSFPIRYINFKINFFKLTANKFVALISTQSASYRRRANRPLYYSNTIGFDVMRECNH